MAKLTDIYQRFISWMLLILLAIMSFKIPSDPDMGWHLQNGLYTIANLWPQQGDIYSWTMPGYKWVSHEWLTEVIMVAVNAVSGLWGLAIVFALLVAFIFWLASIAGGKSFSNASLVAVIGVMIAWPIIGVRPQMITLLGVALLLYILFRWRADQKSKLIYWIPIIFLAWANLHAGFAAGFAVVAVFIFAEAMRLIFLKPSRSLAEPLISLKKLVQLGLITFLGGGVAALINPYGWHIYEEIVVTLTKTDVLGRIAEWLPIDFTATSSYNLLIGGILVLVLLFASRFQVDYTKFTLAVVFFLVATTSWRHLPLFALVSLPFISEQLLAVSRYIFTEVFKSAISVIALVALIIIAGWWHIKESAQVISDPIAYAQAVQFPYGAVQYLKENDLPGNMFNEYNWGGYLIWQLPEKKVFIDGRMAIWDDGTTNIFNEFIEMKGNYRETILSKLDAWKIDLVLVYSRQPINAILDLEREAWQKKYQDSLSVVWQRKVSDPLVQ